MKRFNINGKEYDISFIDTPATVKNLLALDLEKPPTHIRFTKFTNEKIEIETVDQEIKHFFNTSYKESRTDGWRQDEFVIKNLEDKWKPLTKEDFAKTWVTLQLKPGQNELSAFDDKTVPLVNKIFLTNFSSISNLNNELKNYREQKTKLLVQLREQVKKEESYRKKYLKYSPVTTTGFLQDAKILEYTVQVDNDSLELFNITTLTEMIPFVSVKSGDQNYYKFLKNTVPIRSWIEELEEDGILLKMKSDSTTEKWSTIIIKYIDSKKAVITFETGKKVSQLDVENELIVVFQNNFKIETRQEKGIKGMFAVPDLRLSKSVFLELLTNDETLSYFLYTDESTGLTTMKKKYHLFYSTQEDELISVVLSDKKVTRSDPFYMSKDKKVHLNIHTEYLKVRVARALNLEQIQRFQIAFATILAVYKDKFNDIVKEYSTFVKNFTAESPDIKKVTKSRLDELMDLDPELFGSGYSTKCEPKLQPKPITEEEALNLPKDRYMRYPKDSENLLMCDSQKYPYIGLKVSTQDETKRDDYDYYLPCCYSEPHNVPGKKLYEYLNDIRSGQKTSSVHVVESKILTPGKFGYLPRNIHYILNSISAEYMYLRSGVTVTSNSFIEAVLMAIDPRYKDQQNKGAYVEDIRKNLASSNLINQQLYNTDPQKTTKNILDSKMSFDSKLYTNLLEAFLQKENLNCQIIVFTRDDNNPNGGFEIPENTQAYLFDKFADEREMILVYKHFGTMGDKLTNPHYELIVKKPLNENTYIKTFTGKPFISKLYSYFKQTYKIYIPQYGRYEPTTNNLPCKAQILDMYGKTRALLFEDNIRIWTSPLTPLLNVLTVENKDEELPSIEGVKKFLQKYSITILEQDVLDAKLIGLRIKLEGVPYAYIGVKPTGQLLSGIKSGLGLNIFYDSHEINVLETTKQNKKIADFLTQLLLYKFSMWFKDEKPQLSNPNVSLAEQLVAEKANIYRMSKEFSKDNIIVIKNYDYNIKNMQRKITLTSSFFKDGKLVADSEKTRFKLEYYLLHMLLKNKSYVLNFHERVYIDHYYTFSKDFKQAENQLIFIGSTSLINWIDYQKVGSIKKTCITPDITQQEPQFFSHWALYSGFPVIIQNVQNNSLKRALKVAVNFIQNGYNSGYSTENIESDVEFTKYYFYQGRLIKEGTSNISVWQYAPNKYAALLGNLRQVIE